MMETSEGALQALLDSARAKLRAAREKRIRPGRDEKVLTSWNALMIGGMARAARAFERRDLLESARRALDFIRDRLWNGGRLLATYKDGRAHLDAYLDDHAYLLAALGDILLERFQDREAGGFFFTAHDHEKLIQRPKPGPDNATPSGNAVAAFALNRLGFLTGEARYAEAAAATIALFWPQLLRQPAAFGTMLAALEEQLTPTRTVIVCGARDAFTPWRRLLDEAFLPSTLCLYIPAGATGLPPVLAKPATDAVNAWVCEGVTCLQPVDGPDKLRESLGLPRIPPAR
jgi:hypothetical protein